MAKKNKKGQKDCVVLSMYLLDTNALIYYLRGESQVIERIEILLQKKSVMISCIVEAELLSWPELNPLDQEIITNAIATIPIIPVDSEIARLAADLRRMYRIHLLDGLIAATAIRTNAILITRNTKDFKKITELKIEKI